MATVWTNKGMMAAGGRPVVKRTEEGDTYYYKEFHPPSKRDQMYRAYEKLRSLGVGIPYTRTREGVRMTGGVVLPRAVKQGIITRSMKAQLIAKVQEMHRRLVGAGWAHTDVKPQNMVIIKRSDADFDVFLIDNDFALPFGEQREVMTPRVNGYGGDETVNPATDNMGFEAVINFIKNQI